MSLMQNNRPSPDCVGGITRFVDIWVLGENHIFKYPSPKHIYETSSFDPEGILGEMKIEGTGKEMYYKLLLSGTVPSLLQVFLGIVAGQILLSIKGHKQRILRWTIWGTVCLFISLILTSGTFIEGPIPVNKNLW